MLNFIQPFYCKILRGSYTDAFEGDVFVKWKMRAKVCVKSDCEDTCFYVRISIQKENGDYVPEQMVMLEFSFDEDAFLLRRGETLRIDIASADNEHYVRHTNRKGLFSQQVGVNLATNTINLGKSHIVLPIE